MKPTPELITALYDQLKACEADKKERNVRPTHTLRMDLYAIYRDALNELYKAGKIKVGDTLNDKYIKTITNNE